MTSQERPHPPMQVLAVIVRSPEGRNTGLLREAVRSVLTQTRPPEVLVIVDPSSKIKPGPLREVPASDYDIEGAATTIYTKASPKAANFGQASATAIEAFLEEPGTQGPEWIWLLHDDVIADPAALNNMLKLGNPTKSIGAIGPKQVQYGDPTKILELGIEATRTGRRVETIEPDEVDQGQHDGREDVLAVGTAGMLVRATAWDDVGGFDPALGPFGDGLEFGRRLHLAGYRVVVAPNAILEHYRGSYGRGKGEASFGERRGAQLYNWALAAPAWQVPLLVPWFFLLAVGRAGARIAAGAWQMAFREIQGFLKFFFLSPRLAVARSKLSSVSRVPRSSLESLEADGQQVRKARRSSRKIISRGTSQRTVVDEAAALAMRRHRYHSLLALGSVVGMALLLAGYALYPYFGGVVGGQWQQLPNSWSELATQAWSGWVPGGDGAPGVGDGSLILFAVATAPFALVGVAPSSAATALFILAIPLAALAVWVLTGSLTRSIASRTALSVLGASQGALLVPLLTGNLANILGYLAFGVLLAGLLRGLFIPVRFVARGVPDLVAQRTPDQRAWLALAALMLVVVTPTFPLSVPATFVFILAATRFANAAWRKTSSVVLAVSVVAPSVVLYLPAAVTSILKGGLAGGLRWLFPPGDAVAWYDLPFGFPGSLPTESVGPGATGLEGLSGYSLTAVWGVYLGGAFLLIWATGLLLARAKRAESLATGVFLWLVAVAAVAAATIQAIIFAGVTSWFWFLLATYMLITVVAWHYRNYALPAFSLTPVPEEVRGRRRRVLPAALAVIAGTGAIGTTLLAGPMWAGNHKPQVATQNQDAQSGQNNAAAQETVETRVESKFGLFEGWESNYALPAAEPVTPQVAQEAQQGERSARVLAIHADNTQVQAALLRGNGLQAVDFTASSDSLTATQQAAKADLAQIVATLTSVPNDSVAIRLREHGVEMVMLSAASPQADNLRHTLDASADLERIGVVERAYLWRVRPAGGLPAQVAILGSDGATQPLPGSVVGASGPYSSEVSATIVMAEVADPGWVATLGDTELEPVERGWRQAFSVPAGAGELKVQYKRWYVGWWKMASLVALGGALIAALPVRRKRTVLVPGTSPVPPPPSPTNLGELAVFQSDVGKRGNDYADEE